MMGGILRKHVAIMTTVTVQVCGTRTHMRACTPTPTLSWTQQSWRGCMAGWDHQADCNRCRHVTTGDMS